MVLHPHMYRDTGYPVSTNFTGAAPGSRGVTFIACSTSRAFISRSLAWAGPLWNSTSYSSQMFNQSRATE